MRRIDQGPPDSRPGGRRGGRGVRLARRQEREARRVQARQIDTGSDHREGGRIGKIEPRLKFHVKSKISGCVLRATSRWATPCAAARCSSTSRPIRPLRSSSRHSAASSSPRPRSTGRRRLRTRRAASAEQLLPKGELRPAEESFEHARISLAQAKGQPGVVNDGEDHGGGSAMESVVRATAGGRFSSDSSIPVTPSSL